MSKIGLMLNRFGLIITVVFTTLICLTVFAQERADRESRRARRSGQEKPVTVPVTIRVRDPKAEKEIQVDFIVREDSEMQDIISIRRPTEVPLTIAILIQDDLVSSIATETKGVADFVRHLPVGSRVMVGYIRAGTLEVRRKFTGDLERAAASIRPPLGLASAAPFNPYVEIIEALKRFDAQPAGRRAIFSTSGPTAAAVATSGSSPRRWTIRARAAGRSSCPTATT